MRGKAHSEELRAQVMAALLTGQAVGEVASAFNLDISVVSRWRSRIPANKLQEVATKRDNDIEALLIAYVRTNLQTLKAQSEVAGREKYIEKQPASELAVLHGVIADKTVRILASFQPEQEPESGNELVN